MKQKFPILITLTSLFLGLFIAIIFGVNEDFIKNNIKEGLKSHPKIEVIAKAELPKFLKKEADKNWRYYQRFHFHSTGIGAISLGALLLLSMLSAPSGQKLIVSYMISISGFLYPFVWLFAGMFGPSMGRSAAKESFAIFGYMGGVYLVCFLVLIFFTAKYDIKFLTKQS